VRGISRLVVVAVIAVLAFGVALVSFREPPASECQMDSTANPDYSARVEEPPDVNRTVYHLVVTRRDQPVRGAKVCMRADMGGLGGMSGMGTSNVARETGPGRYEVAIRFEMSGFWRSTVIVDDGQGKPVAIPFDVRVS
jgi:YtkA-like protein